MLETIAVRALAVMGGLMGLTVLYGAAQVGLSDGPPESWKRLVARVAFGLTLLYVARLAWRRPASRAERGRRRLLRLAGVLASPDLQREFFESSPTVGLSEALLTDWAAAARALDDETVSRSLGVVEQEELSRLHAEVVARMPALRDRRERPDAPGALQGDADWLALQAAASAAVRRIAEAGQRPDA